MKKFSALLFSLLLLATLDISAQLRLPAIITDHMVVQANEPFSVWGWADKGSKVSVQIAGKKVSAKADGNGQWKVSVPAMQYGGPYTMTITSGKQTLTVQDILVGEVWVCSGQSNMEFQLKAVNNADEEIHNATNSNIRSFDVINDMARFPKADLSGQWRVTTPQTAGNFSAIGYLFANEIAKTLNCPVGIINTSWGGTDIESWMSMEMIDQFPKYKRLMNRLRSEDLESYLAHGKEVEAKFLEAIKNEKGEPEGWYKPEFSKVDWKQIKVPGLWTIDELSGVDGVVWTNTTIDVPAHLAGKQAVLSLGIIDDDDVTWVNGVKVGSTIGYDVKRRYIIPKGVLKAGKNDLTVKIIDNHGGGGCYGSKDFYFLQIGQETLSILDNPWTYRIAIDNEAFEYVEDGPNAFPSRLYNAMVAPITNYTAKGFLWYQGENNAPRADEYYRLFPAMIGDWRNRWGKNDMPFYWVQLANYMPSSDSPSESNWATLRDAQNETLKVPHTGQAVIIDVGDANDIHPRDKQTVAHRLALLALNNDYGKKSAYCQSPQPKKAVLDVDGNIVVTFSNVADGLVLKNRYNNACGFSVAGGDGKYMWVKGEIIAKDKVKLILPADMPPYATSVRYAWADNPDDANLYNTAGLPATPFQLEVESPKWISDGHDADYKRLAIYRKKFGIEKPVVKATLTIASAGLHEVTINGVKVGNHRLDPMYTRFDCRILSVSHDVTSMLVGGYNDLRIELGNGWYNHQSTAVWFFHEASWRNRPCVSASLHLQYVDGTEGYICTDSTWTTTGSKIVFSSIYTAEHYDARISPNDQRWLPVTEVKCPTKKVTPQTLCPIRCTATYAAEKMEKLSDTLYVYHFPKNLAGVSRIKVRGERGTVLRLKHGEMLYADGRVNTENIDYHYRPTDDTDPFQVDILTLSGDMDEFAARFNYKGFQYVEVSSSRPIELKIGDLVAEEMHSDVPQTGTWQSSSDMLNKLHAATNNSYLSNLFGYPTDCPQREKNGWAADAYLAIEAGMNSYDASSVYEKWLQDMRDEQRPTGELPCIVPTDKWGYDWANGVDWTSTCILIPWNVYLYTGKLEILADNYELMNRYMQFVSTKTTDFLTDWGLGDWIPVSTQSDLKYTTSVYYYVDATIMQKVARLLGNSADAEKYSLLAKNILNSINSTYLDRKTGIYAGGSQTEQSMALYWGVCPEDMRQKVAAQLNKKVEDAGCHLDVGVHGCKAILGALSDNGYIDTAYRLATQTTYPSWGYWITQGATTLHENWKTDVIQDNSLNHIMFGEIGAWLYKSLAGISPSEAGYAVTNVRPYFPEDMDSLTVSRQTPYGVIASHWYRTTGRINYTLSIPGGMKVNLTLPDGRQLTLQTPKQTSYTYQFDTAPKKKALRILAIGNSFSRDAVEMHLHDLAKADGRECVIGNLYIPGCPIIRHVQNLRVDAQAYEYRKIGTDGKMVQIDSKRLSEALAEEEWDYISVQQGSYDSGNYDSFNLLPELVEYVRQRVPGAKVVFHQTWAYAKNSIHGGFKRYNNNQQTMYNCIVDCAKRAEKDCKLDGVIPSGTAIQNGRATTIGDNLNCDGHHLNQLGKYIAACTWFEKCFAKSVVDNAYVPRDITAEEGRLAQQSAHLAAKKYSK